MVSYCFDLTDPDAKRMELGRVRVHGDKYLGSSMMIRNMPENMRAVAETWLPHKNRAVSEVRKLHDPVTLTDYFCKTLRHSSYYISMVKSGPG